MVCPRQVAALAVIGNGGRGPCVLGALAWFWRSLPIEPTPGPWRDCGVVFSEENIGAERALRGGIDPDREHPSTSRDNGSESVSLILTA